MVLSTTYNYVYLLKVNKFQMYLCYTNNRYWLIRLYDTRFCGHKVRMSVRAHSHTGVRGAEQALLQTVAFVQWRYASAINCFVNIS